jgi:MFS family permease
MAMASLSWALMVLPMCVVRLAMLEVGLGARQGVFVIEAHFLGMYATGFVSGKLIHRFGPRAMSWVAALLFLVSIVVLQLADGSTAATWIAGMVVLGIAWNVGFTSATVWTSRAAYDAAAQPHLRAPVQAANDFFMFLFVGGWVMGSTYIFESAGGSIEGWRAVTGPVLAALLALAVAVLLVDAFLDRRDRGRKLGCLPA